MGKTNFVMVQGILGASGEHYRMTYLSDEELRWEFRLVD